MVSQVEWLEHFLSPKMLPVVAREFPLVADPPSLSPVRPDRCPKRTQRERIFNQLGIACRQQERCQIRMLSELGPSRPGA
jgi:hypothetical protein